ncbi:hypothetical protein [Mucilaginibacter rubeus]|uniref:Uncharacterized protein n=1 Tax=Mucilaginibacter rubeus TaxID=2027860 RepID=A0A5C1HVV1_9SPHI|nr:hypothetical protein [Mucilaginibacter rubeus]QEM09211.1 hypothetical protein DEO27_004005 [Mucilaginibacter rubeus]
MEIVGYRDWILVVDKEQTEALYRQVEMGGTQSCVCDTCKYFEAITDDVYPDEVRQLFEKLGIDISKNYEVFDLEGEGNERCFYGVFHFKGDLIAGDDCWIPTVSGGYHLELLPVNDIFMIGFSKAAQISFFEKEEEIVEIKFMTKVS